MAHLHKRNSDLFYVTTGSPTCDLVPVKRRLFGRIIESVPKRLPTVPFVCPQSADLLSRRRPFDLQINRMTSWIDGSFVYSISEAWVNAMRSFENGTFKTGEQEGLPPRNKDRVPLFTAPAPHVMRMVNPERMLRKSTEFRTFPARSLARYASADVGDHPECAHLICSFGRPEDQPESGHFGYRHHVLSLPQCRG